MELIINTIVENIELLYKQLDEVLCNQGVSFDVQYGNKHFSLMAPIDKEHGRQLKRDRHRFITLMLKNAITQEIKNVPKSNRYNPYWHIVRSFQKEYLSTWEKLNPGEISDVYEVPGETTELRSKPLNLDSLDVNNQRKDWTHQKQLEFINKKYDVPVSESDVTHFVEIHRNLYKKSQDDSMSGENSSS